MVRVHQGAVGKPIPDGTYGARASECGVIQRRRSTGIGLLRDGGASRGNLLSGEADHLILTVSRLEAEKKFFGLLAVLVRRGQLVQDFAVTNGLAPLLFK